MGESLQDYIWSLEGIIQEGVGESLPGLPAPE